MSGMCSRSGLLPEKHLAYFDFQFSLCTSKINVYFTFIIFKVFRNMGKNDFVFGFRGLLLALRRQRPIG